MRLIDADELKESLKDLKAEGYNQKYVQGLQDAIDNYFSQIIDDAPTVDVQPVKHAQWIFQNRHDEDGRCIYHCSECNFEIKVFPCNLVLWQMHEKYCARCGAQMDGDSE